MLTVVYSTYYAKLKLRHNQGGRLLAWWLAEGHVRHFVLEQHPGTGVVSTRNAGGSADARGHLYSREETRQVGRTQRRLLHRRSHAVGGVADLVFV